MCSCPEESRVRTSRDQREMLSLRLHEILRARMPQGPSGVIFSSLTNSHSTTGPSVRQVGPMKHPDTPTQTGVALSTVYPSIFFGWEEVERGGNPGFIFQECAIFFNTFSILCHIYEKKHIFLICFLCKKKAT